MAYFKLTVQAIKDEEVLVALTKNSTLIGDLVITKDSVYSNRRQKLENLIEKIADQLKLEESRTLNEFQGDEYCFGMDSDVEDVLEYVPKDKIVSYFGEPD